MASIKSLLEPTSEPYEYPSEQLPIKPKSPDSSHQKIKTEQTETESPFSNLDLKTFQRVAKKTHVGYGTRTFPPKIDSLKSELFHFRRNIAFGRVKQKNAALEALRLYPKPYKFSRDQKMRGYIVDKEFKPRKWNSESLKISTVGGKTLSLPCYTATPPLERHFSQDPPYRQIPGLEHKYFVSTITKPIVRPGPMMPIPIPSVPIRAPITNHLLPIAHSKSSKERMSCPVPNCNKDFADRSSLNRHKKRMHPELASSRSNPSRP